MSVVDVSGLVAGYRSWPVTRPLDLTVGAGEVVALLGPNGAGKTAIVLTLGGVNRPHAGRGAVLDAPLGSLSTHRLVRRGLALVPDGNALSHRLTVAQNLALRRRGEGAIPAFELFPSLAPLARQKAGLLSGGEQRMLALAAALRLGPRLLIVDELSLGLAPGVAADLILEIRTVADRLGVGVLIVEQHAHAALAVADRAYVIREGRLVASGPAASIRLDSARLASTYLGNHVWIEARS